MTSAKRCSTRSAPDENMQAYGRGLRRRLPPMVGGDPRRVRMLTACSSRSPARRCCSTARRSAWPRTSPSPAERRGPHADAVVRRPARRLLDRRGRLPARGQRGGRVPARMNVAAQRRARVAAQLDGAAVRRRHECPELGCGTWTVIDAGHAAVLRHRADWEGSTVLALHSFAGERLGGAARGRAGDRCGRRPLRRRSRHPVRRRARGPARALRRPLVPAAPRRPAPAAVAR